MLQGVDLCCKFLQSGVAPQQCVDSLLKLIIATVRPQPPQPIPDVAEERRATERRRAALRPARQRAVWWWALREQSETTRILGLRLLRFAAMDASGMPPAPFGSTPTSKIGARARAEHDAAGCVRLADELSKHPISHAIFREVLAFATHVDGSSGGTTGSGSTSASSSTRGGGRSSIVQRLTTPRKSANALSIARASAGARSSSGGSLATLRSPQLLRLILRLFDDAAMTMPSRAAAASDLGQLFGACDGVDPTSPLLVWKRNAQILRSLPGWTRKLCLPCHHLSSVQRRFLQGETETETRDRAVERERKTEAATTLSGAPPAAAAAAPPPPATGAGAAAAEGEVGAETEAETEAEAEAEALYLRQTLRTAAAAAGSWQDVVDMQALLEFITHQNGDSSSESAQAMALFLTALLDWIAANPAPWRAALPQICHLATDVVVTGLVQGEVLVQLRRSTLQVWAVGGITVTPIVAPALPPKPRSSVSVRRSSWAVGSRGSSPVSSPPAPKRASGSASALHLRPRFGAGAAVRVVQLWLGGLSAVIRQSAATAATAPATTTTVANDGGGMERDACAAEYVAGLRALLRSSGFIGQQQQAGSNAVAPPPRDLALVVLRRCINASEEILSGGDSGADASSNFVRTSNGLTNVLVGVARATLLATLADASRSTPGRGGEASVDGDFCELLSKAVEYGFSADKEKARGVWTALASHTKLCAGENYFS